MKQATLLRRAPHHGRSDNRAFTLIELLVVIALIGLLISILLPSLGNARKTAWGVICQSNLRQLGVSIQTYLDDQKDPQFLNLQNPLYPNVYYQVGVVEALQPYLGNAGQKPFECPAAKGLASVRDPLNVIGLQGGGRVFTLPYPGFNQPVTAWTEYWFNDSAASLPGTPGGLFQVPYGVSNQKMRLIKNPQWVVWSMDAIDEYPRHFGRRTSRNPADPNDRDTTGKSNLLFGDQAVKTMDYVDYQEKPDPANAPAPFYNWGHLYYRITP